MISYIVYFTSAFNGTMLGTLLDEAMKIIKQENTHIYFMTCDNILETCLSNPTGKKNVCTFCKAHTINTIKKTLGNDRCTILYKKDFDSVKSNQTFEFKTIEDLKKIEYKNVKIGYSALSTFVHFTRNHEPFLDLKTKQYFEISLNQAMRLTDYFQQVIEKVKPTKVLSYNGRFNEFRPIYETAIHNKIDIEMFEVVRLKDHRFFKVSFQNMLPHNVKDNLWRVDACWEYEKYKSGENIEIGKNFFERRRSGQVAGDKVYVGGMLKGELPQNWNTNKRNIVIFNSSEDEFVAIGDEYATLNLFKSQMDGIKFIFESFKDDEDINFYVRIHPNLTGIQFSYHLDLYKFEKLYRNVTIIPPESPVNSYDLMESAEKVIVFGSTMGLESAYWKKPVILLSCAFYYYSDFCYVPKNEDQLKVLIKNKIEHIESENIIKFGLYYFDKSAVIIDNEEQFKYINYNPIKINLMKKVFHGFEYKKILGSTFIAAVLTNFLRYLATKTSKSRYTYSN